MESSLSRYRGTREVSRKEVHTKDSDRRSEEFYDPNYLAFFGMCRALESYLTQFKDNLGLTIDQEAIRFLANGLVNLDCDVQ